MAHRHAYGIMFTGPDIEAKDGEHYHVVPGGKKTFPAKDGPKHTHVVPGGKPTTGPLPMKKAKSSDEDSAWMKKSKKKKKKKDKDKDKPGEY